MQKAMKEKKHISKGQVVLLIVLGIFALCCFLPVLLVFIVSISSKESIDSIGFTFFPASFSLDGYKYMAGFLGQIGHAYLVTIYETVVGTLWTLLLCSMFGYAISRKNFRMRIPLAVLLLISMLFSGGTLATYLVKAGMYNLRNNLWVLILPGVNAYTCIVLRTFIQANVPDSLIESAKIDGAGEFFIYFKVVLPLIVPALAAMGFMTAVGHWNEWQTAYLYMDDIDKSTLQLVLIRIENNIEYLKQNVELLSPEQAEEFKNIPAIPTRMAILFVTLGPVLVVYPFFQKYFIKGITVGAVKG